MMTFEQAEKLAVEKGLSRKTLNWGFDRTLNQFQVTVEVSGWTYHAADTNFRTETDIYFVDAINASEALKVARTMATGRFVGEDVFPKDAEESEGGNAPQEELPIGWTPSGVPPLEPSKKNSVAQTSQSSGTQETLGANSSQDPVKRKPGRPPKSQQMKSAEEDVRKPTNTTEESLPLSEKVSPEPSLPVSTKSSEEKPKKAIKFTPYNPDLKEHKILLASFLNKEADKVGDWAKNPKTGEWSKVTMRGQDFLDEKGEIVKSFKDAAFDFFGDNL